MSRPGYIDRRGNWKARKRRKIRLLEKFDPELQEWHAARREHDEAAS